MTLIATAGASDANSFVTLADALGYQLGRRGAAQFAELAGDEQEALLIRATQDISLAMRWTGEMVSENQALPLPMVGQTDGFGRALAENIIPPLVAQATALYALVLLEDGAEVARSTQQVQRLRKGDTEVTYATNTNTWPLRPSLIPAEIWNLLRFYGTVPRQGMQMPVYRG